MVLELNRSEEIESTRNGLWEIAQIVESYFEVRFNRDMEEILWFGWR